MIQIYIFIDYGCIIYYLLFIIFLREREEKKYIKNIYFLRDIKYRKVLKRKSDFLSINYSAIAEFI
jgi:hypothetical protein